MSAWSWHLVAGKNKQIKTCVAILAIVIPLLISNTKAQSETAFTQNATFDIPTKEAKISFGANGTYTSATLANGTWSFKNLKLEGYRILTDLNVSARNSNIIITSFMIWNTTARVARLRYVAEGLGEQTFQMGIAAGEGRWGLHPEWSVIANGIWLGEGDAWKITSDGTVTIKSVTGNVSISHYSFLGLGESQRDLSFFEQHSVSITTIAIAGLIVILGTIVRIKTKKGMTTNGVNLKNTQQIRCE